MIMTIAIKTTKQKILSFMRVFSCNLDWLIFFVEKYSKYVDKKKKNPPISTESWNIDIFRTKYIELYVEKTSQKGFFFLTFISILRRNVTSTS